MPYEKETLKLLRISLDKEDDETSIIPVLKNHHKYLKEYISILMSDSTSFRDKQSTASIFLTILNMHMRAEEEILYHVLGDSTNRDVRLEGLRGKSEHELMYELIDELKSMGADTSWSEVIDAQMQVLAGLVKNHLKEEEQITFHVMENFMSEYTLMDLTDDYLDRCKVYLGEVMDDTTLEVSRNDVITFFY